MHIAMVAGEYPPLWGGLGSAAYNLCKFLTEMGHEISLITRKMNKKTVRPKIKNVEIFEVKWLYAPMFFTRSYGKNALKEIVKINSEKNIDVIHLHCPLVSLNEKEIIHLKKNIAPVLTSLHGSWLGERDGILAAQKHNESAVWRNPNDLAILLTAKYFSKFERAAARASDICVANSVSTKNDFIERYLLGKTWDCEVIHWGVDEKLFSPLDHDSLDDQTRFKKIRRRYNAADNNALSGKYTTNTPLLLAVGRLAARKGFRFLLKSMPTVLRKFPQAKLVIIGRGKMHKILNKQAKKLGISDSVTIESGMDFRDLADCYKSADLVIYPSFYEGQGLIPLEAMASGTPVVTVNDGPLPEMVDKTVGSLYNVGDYNHLGLKILEELDNPENRKLKAKNGRKRILTMGTFTHKKTAESFNRLYEKILN